MLGSERLLLLNKCSRLSGTTHARAVQILHSNQGCDEAIILVLTRVSQREADRNVRVLDSMSSSDIGFQRLQNPYKVRLTQDRPSVSHTHIDERSTVGRAGTRNLNRETIKSSNAITITRGGGVHATDDSDIGSEGGDLRERRSSTTGVLNGPLLSTVTTSTEFSKIRAMFLQKRC